MMVVVAWGDGYLAAVDERTGEWIAGDERSRAALDGPLHRDLVEQLEGDVVAVLAPGDPGHVLAVCQNLPGATVERAPRRG